MLVDATAIGQPFLDILNKHRLGVHTIAITSGGRLSFATGIQRVPKRDLLRAANYLLTADCFRVPPGFKASSTGDGGLPDPHLGLGQ